MAITQYSFLMGILWFNVFIILATAFRRSNRFLLMFRILTLLTMMVAGLLRIIFPLEFSFTKVLKSTSWFPAIQGFLLRPFVFELSVIHTLCIVWFAGFVIALAQTLLQHIAFVRRSKRLPLHADRALVSLLNAALEEKKLRVPMALKTDPIAKSPYISGFLKPTIYLPNTEFTSDDLFCIFRHEIRHYYFRDLWIKLFMQMLRCFFWWNPCVYLLISEMDCALEMKCDLDVVKSLSKEHKKDYCRCILNVLRGSTGLHQGKKQPYAAWFVSAKSEKRLTQRLRYSLACQPKNMEPKVTLSCMCIFMLFVASYFIVVQPAYYAVPPDLPATVDVFAITSENSYLVDNGDETYAVFADQAFRFSIDEEALRMEPYLSLEIKSKEGGT